MDAIVQVGITGAVAGVVSALVNGVIAPRINWGIEKKREQLKHKRELIALWRKMAHSYWREGSGKVVFPSYLEKHLDYYSLKPLLKNDQELVEIFNRGQTPTEATNACHARLLEIIASIEREWGLL